MNSSVPSVFKCIIYWSFIAILYLFAKQYVWDNPNIPLFLYYIVDLLIISVIIGVIVARQNKIKHYICILNLLVLMILIIINSLRFFNVPINYVYYENNDAVTIYKSLYVGKVMEFPNSLNGKKVVSVSCKPINGVTPYSKYIDKVIFPETVTYIDEYSTYFSDAKDIIFKGKIDKLYAHSFSPNTQRIIFEDDVGAIAPFAFDSLGSLNKVEFYGDVEYAFEYSFSNCGNAEIIYYASRPIILSVE